MPEIPDFPQCVFMLIYYSTIRPFIASCIHSFFYLSIHLFVCPCLHRECDEETRKEIAKKRKAVKKLHNEAFSLRMDMLYKLSMSHHVSWSSHSSIHFIIMHPFICSALYVSISFHSTEILYFGYLTTWTLEVGFILYLLILLTCVSDFYYVIKALLILSL